MKTQIENRKKMVFQEQFSAVWGSEPSYHTRFYRSPLACQYSLRHTFSNPSSGPSSGSPRRADAHGMRLTALAPLMPYTPHTSPMVYAALAPPPHLLDSTALYIDRLLNARGGEKIHQ